MTNRFENVNGSSWQTVATEQTEVTEKIKAIVAMYHKEGNYISDGPKLQDRIEAATSLPYDQADKMFVELHQKSIVHFAMEQRMNRVKELLVYSNLDPDAVATLLHYSSAKEMAEELHEHTGLSLSFFTNLKISKARLASESSTLILNLQ